jgi:hypothetical protein
LTSVGDKDSDRTCVPWGFRQLLAPKSYARDRNQFQHAWRSKSTMPLPFTA